MKNDAIIARDAAKAELEKQEKEVYTERRKREIELQKVRKEAEEKKIQQESFQRRLVSFNNLDFYCRLSHAVKCYILKKSLLKSFQELLRCAPVFS